MITFWYSCLIQLENTLYGAVIVLLSMIIGGERERWYRIIDENSPFRNPFFLTYMIIVWFIGCPWLAWYYQIPRYGLWQPLYQISPYMAPIIRIAFSITLIWCVYHYKYKRAESD